jgi:hypothetical protein
MLARGASSSSLKTRLNADWISSGARRGESGPGTRDRHGMPGIRPDNAASYFWRTTTYNSFFRGRRRGNFVPHAILQTTAPRRKRLQKREATRNAARAASVLLKSSPKKRIRSDDIPPSLRMSGQFCTNRDLNCTTYRRPSTPLGMRS